MGTPVEELTGLPCMVVWVIHAAGSPADSEKGLVFTHPGATGRSCFPNWLAAALGTCRGETLPWLPLSSPLHPAFGWPWLDTKRHSSTFSFCADAGACVTEGLAQITSP